MNILYEFSEVYEDEDGWFRFTVTTPNGTVVESDEYYAKENALKDREYIFSSNEETNKFLNLTEECPICGRPYDLTMSDHHLIPKCKKGKETVALHRVCHDFLHATFTDKELAREYNTVEKLMQDERVQKFGKWCSNKLPNFTDPSTMSNRKNPNKRK